MFNVRCFIFLCIGAAVRAISPAVLASLVGGGGGGGGGYVTYIPPNLCYEPTPGNGTTLNIDGVDGFQYSVYTYKSFYITVNCEESYELFGKKTVRCVNGTYLEPLGECVPRLPTNANASQSNKDELCELPEHPKHATYEYSGNANSGKANLRMPHQYKRFTLTFKCNYGYELKGNNEITCSYGSWSSDMPTCEPKYGYLADPLETGTRKRLPHCIVPDAPKDGSYSIIGETHPKIPKAYTKVFVDITCNEGYQLHGQQSISCTSGKWTAEMPLCGLPCYLKKDSNVDYMCETSNGLVICNDYVRPGEIVVPKCKDNITRDDLTVMRCTENGYFDHVETCAKEDIAVACGLIKVNNGLIIGGFEVVSGEVPWHAGLYSKDTEPFQQICGGTIVTSTAVISAAHCFWTNEPKVILPHKYSVAVGKIYRPWNDMHDIFAQKLEVAAVEIATNYFGSSANYQNDLAVLKLLTEIEFNRYVRPICLDFNEEINGNRLDDGMRKVAGWGLKTEEGETSQVLKAVYLPIVRPKKCSEESPYEFRPYITPDKICAGYTNGTAVCKGDSGGGLTFHRVENGVYKHYLQGVVSNAPANGALKCNAYTWATFTSIVKLKGFIYDHIK